MPVQLSLTLSGALLVELRLDLRPLRPFLGDRGFGSPLLRSLTMMVRVVTRRVGLHAAELTPTAGAPGNRDHNRKNDESANGYGDDCKG
jgi:hypothetical protein